LSILQFYFCSSPLWKRGAGGDLTANTMTLILTSIAEKHSSYFKSFIFKVDVWFKKTNNQNIHSKYPVKYPG